MGRNSKVLRRSLVAFLLIFASASTSAEAANAASGPVKAYPNPKFVAQLKCRVEYDLPKSRTLLFVVNTTGIKLSAGQKISWSFHVEGTLLTGRHTWGGTDVRNVTTLTSQLVPWESLKIAEATLESKFSNCRASTTIG